MIIDSSLAAADYREPTAAIYRELLAGKFDAEINRGLTSTEQERSAAGMDALIKA